MIASSNAGDCRSTFLMALVLWRAIHPHSNVLKTVSKATCTCLCFGACCSTQGILLSVAFYCMEYNGGRWHSCDPQDLSIEPFSAMMTLQVQRSRAL
jgi:hypothetical protein